MLAATSLISLTALPPCDTALPIPRPLQPRLGQHAKEQGGGSEDPGYFTMVQAVNDLESRLGWGGPRDGYPRVPMALLLSLSASVYRKGGPQDAG